MFVLRMIQSTVDDADGGVSLDCHWPRTCWSQFHKCWVSCRLCPCAVDTVGSQSHSGCTLNTLCTDLCWCPRTRACCTSMTLNLVELMMRLILEVTMRWLNWIWSSNCVDCHFFDGSVAAGWGNCVVAYHWNWLCLTTERINENQIKTLFDKLSKNSLIAVAETTRKALLNTKSAAGNEAIKWKLLCWIFCWYENR